MKTQREKTIEDILHVVAKDFLYLVIPVMLFTPLSLIFAKGLKGMFIAQADTEITWQSDYWRETLISGVVDKKVYRQRPQIDLYIKEIETTLKKANEQFNDFKNLNRTVAKMRSISPGAKTERIAKGLEKMYLEKQNNTKTKEAEIAFETKTYQEERIKDKRFLKVQFWHTDSSIAVHGANLIPRIIESYMADIERQKASKRLTYLKRQTVYYQKKFDVARSVLDKYKESTRRVFTEERESRIKELLGFDPGIRIDEISYDKFKGDLVDLNLELKGLMDTKTDLESELQETDEFIIDEYAEEEDAELRALKENLSEKKLLLARLSIDSSSTHPLVRQVKQEIINIEQLIERVGSFVEKSTTRTYNPVYETLKEKLSDLKTQINAVKTKIELTSLTIDDMKEKLEASKQIRSKVDSLTKEVKEAKNLYQNFRDKLKEEELQADLNENERKFGFDVTPAKKATNLLLTNRMSILSKQFGMGLLIGLAIVYIRNIRDTSFRSALELRKELKVPIFGTTSLIVATEEIEKTKKIWQMIGMGYAAYLSIIIAIFIII